jgi:hypothetical protein
MNNKSIVVAVVIFILIVAGMFVFAYLKQAEAPAQLPEATNTPVVLETAPYVNITQITAKHFFIDGIHTIAGEMLVPTPCDLLSWDSRIVGQPSPRATINFTILNSAETCAQTVTPARFMVTFMGAEDIAIEATFQGKPINLNLIAPAEGETPEEFETFIKG